MAINEFASQKSKLLWGLSCSLCRKLILKRIAKDGFLQEADPHIAGIDRREFDHLPIELLVLEVEAQVLLFEHLILEFIQSALRPVVQSPLLGPPSESVCRWVSVHYLWRPNLPDEGDNHILELAVAGGAEIIVTQNVRDFRRGELQFPEIQILTPSEFLRKVV